MRLRTQPGTSQAGPLLLTLAVVVSSGFLLLVIRGSYLAVGYSFAFELMVDRRLGVWEAMETSRKRVSERWFGILAFVLLSALINVVGALTIVGTAVTMPLLVTSGVAAYADIFGLAPTHAKPITSSN